MFERPSFNKKEAEEKSPSNNKSAILGAALLAGLGATGNAEAQQHKDLSPEGQKMIEELLRKPEMQKLKKEADERKARTEPRGRTQYEYEVRDKNGTIILKGNHDTGMVPIEKPDTK